MCLTKGKTPRAGPNPASELQPLVHSKQAIDHAEETEACKNSEE